MKVPLTGLCNQRSGV